MSGQCDEVGWAASVVSATTTALTSAKGGATTALAAAAAGGIGLGLQELQRLESTALEATEDPDVPPSPAAATRLAEMATKVLEATALWIPQRN